MITMLAGCLLARPAQQQVTWPLWENYADCFMDQQGRIVDYDAGNRTTSEGQAYALFFALVANDRARFNKLLLWTEQNLALGNLKANLPAWRWENKAGQWKITDPNSASDADLWIAYTLLEAGHHWDDAHLSSIGRALAGNIAEREVVDLPGFGKALLPGASGFKTSDGFYQLNASYVPVQVLLGLKHRLNQGPWGEIAERVPALVRGSSPAGFALDWIAFRPEEGFSIFPSPTGQNLASYDAIRVYLWAGMMNDSCPYKKEILGADLSMSKYMSSHSVPPAEITGSGQVVNPNGSVGFSAAVLPYLEALNMRSALSEQVRRLQSEKNTRTGLYGDKPRYYDQNLALFATGWSEGRFHFDGHGLLQVTWK